MDQTNPRYKADASNVKRNSKRSGRDWRPTTTCWHLTYKSKAKERNNKRNSRRKETPCYLSRRISRKMYQGIRTKRGNNV